MRALPTRLTTLLDISYPILSAPMAFAAGGKLAAAVTRSGGLGLIGGGYGDANWLDEQIKLAGDARVGVGFITWSLAQSPDLLTRVLQSQPAAIMLSFGDPGPFAAQIHDAGAKLICQCQNLAHVKQALDAGADIVVAQGGEAGGHGAWRSTMTLVPEVHDYIQAQGADTVVVAAGGIADGRGLAAARMLGAEGILMGTRFWASSEALVHVNHHDALLKSNGDGTIKTQVADIARRISWPAGFEARIRRNRFTARWHGNEAALKEQAAQLEHTYHEAFAQGDSEEAGVFFGEAAGLIQTIEPVDTLMNDIMKQARQLLGYS